MRSELKENNMSILGSKYDKDDSDDYDGPIGIGSGLRDHIRKKEIRRELKEKYDYEELSDVPEHLVNETFEEENL